jgi:hypothetical protein
MGESGGDGKTSLPRLEGVEDFFSWFALKRLERSVGVRLSAFSHFRRINSEINQ